MAVIDIETLRVAIKAAGHDWQPIALPADFKPRALGWEPTPAPTIELARTNALRIMTEIRPDLFRAPMAAAGKSAVGGFTTHPRKFDWRDHGVIGPVTDQGYCGSCVSFACTGLVGAMVGVEHAGASVHLSEADSHFNSSHGAHCSGWNNGDCLHQIQSRGVAADTDLNYDAAFDHPRQDDHTLPEGNPVSSYLWQAHVRAIPNRDNRIYKVLDVTAWTGDDRKIYLANIGPLTCGFTVYEDFDSYGGGVYHHVSGNSRGGHAVMVVGYDDDAQCWICRNSWGAGFGGAAHGDGTGGGFFKIGYGQCGIDGEAFFGAQGVTVPAPLGWGGWWQIQGGVSAPNTSVFGVSRSADKLDVMAVGTDHGTYAAAWEPGVPHWGGWWRVKGGVTAPDTSISLVTRSADHLDAFCVGTDHHVYTAAWQPGFTEWGGWWPVQGGIAAPGTSVFGVSRSTDKLDIFCVGTDHGTYTAAWEPAVGHWQGWWRVQGGVAAPNTSVTAVSRAPDHLDIFCVGTDHRIYTAAWEPGFTSWRGWWPVQGGVAAPNTSVFGVSRSLNHLDIFCIGTDRQVYTAAWEPGFTDGWHGWWSIGHFRAMAGTSVHAVSRSPDQIDIFAVGEDGGIYTSSWHPGLPRWAGWSRVLGGAAAPGTMVTGIARSPHRLDVFAVGTDHHIYTAGYHDPFVFSDTIAHEKLDTKILVKP